jgi:hypothetical protein
VAHSKPRVDVGCRHGASRSSGADHRTPAGACRARAHEGRGTTYPSGRRRGEPAARGRHPRPPARWLVHEHQRRPAPRPVRVAPGRRALGSVRSLSAGFGRTRFGRSSAAAGNLRLKVASGTVGRRTCPRERRCGSRMLRPPRRTRRWARWALGAAPTVGGDEAPKRHPDGISRQGNRRGPPRRERGGAVPWSAAQDGVTRRAGTNVRRTDRRQGVGGGPVMDTP